MRNGGAFFDIFREKHPQRFKSFLSFVLNFYFCSELFDSSCVSNHMIEVKPTRVGPQIAGRRSSTLEHVLITFLVLGHAYIKEKIKNIHLSLAMLKSVTY